jgi:hypothetical protein
VPGPHDFTVRTGADHRLAPRTVHRIRPAFVTIARAPLCGTECVRIYTDLPLRKIRIFFTKGLDRKLGSPEILPDGQISTTGDDLPPLEGNYILDEKRSVADKLMERLAKTKPEPGKTK